MQNGIIRWLLRNQKEGIDCYLWSTFFLYVLNHTLRVIRIDEINFQSICCRISKHEKNKTHSWKTTLFDTFISRLSRQHTNEGRERISWIQNWFYSGFIMVWWISHSPFHFKIIFNFSWIGILFYQKTFDIFVWKIVGH